MADQQRTTPRRMPSAEFRSAYARLAEPVDVTVLGRVIGHWYPAGVPKAWQHSTFPLSVPDWDTAQLDPPVVTSAPRPGPENPPADSQAGDVRTQAQIGAPDVSVVAPAGNPSGARVLAHGTEDERAPSRGDPQVPAPRSFPEPQRIIPPREPLIVDPGFNAKGSRAVPKTGGKR